jgi:heat shock protein HslJ
MKLLLPCIALGATLVAARAGGASGQASGPSGAPSAAKDAAAAPAALRETTWRLVALRGRPVARVDGQAEPQLVLHGNGRAEGFSGCNRFFGGWKAEGGDALRIGPLATTRMGCLATPGAEQQFLAALDAARRQRLAGAQLELLDAQGVLLMRFEPMPRR